MEQLYCLKENCDFFFFFRTICYAPVASDLVHDKYEVATFMDYIIRDLKNTCPEMNSISFFSDGAASQFKNKYLFENITHYQDTYNLQHVSWNFFATSHGKGSVDGIGGQVKRVVFTACRRAGQWPDAGIDEVDMREFIAILLYIGMVRDVLVKQRTATTWHQEDHGAG